MKTRQLFARYQKTILAFANTSFGMDYLGVKYKDLPVVLVAPDGIHQKLDEQNNVAVFYSRSPYLKKLEMALRGIEIIEQNGYKVKSFFDKIEYIVPNYQGLIAPQKWLPSVVFLDKVYEPNPHPETTSVDGSVYIQEGSTNWATVRDAASGQSIDSTTDDSSSRSHCMSNFNHSGGDPDRYSIGRGYFLFDTYTINPNYTISSVVFSVYNNVTFEYSNPSYCVVTSAPASNTALVSADYSKNNFGSSVLASVAFSTLAGSGGSYRNHSLGAAAVVAGGVTKLGTRTTHDINNSAPPTRGNNMSFTYFAENGANEPYLTVTYTKKTTPIMFF